jgi:Spy/CpxP family protein refolding chaperone
MHTFCKWVLVLAVPAVWAVPARPGEEPEPPNATTVQLLLLRQKSVQQDLKLSPDLANRIRDFTNKEHEAFHKALKLGKEERLRKVEELEQANKKFLQDNLSAAQRKRLEQIHLQVTALHQLTRPEAAKALNLTEAQQNRFKEMHTQARKKFIAILEAKDREGRNQKLAKLREEVYKAIGEVLTAEQKAKANEIVGERFTGELLIEEPDGPTCSSCPAGPAAASIAATRSPWTAGRANWGLGAAV